MPVAGNLLRGENFLGNSLRWRGYRLVPGQPRPPASLLTYDRHKYLPSLTEHVPNSACPDLAPNAVIILLSGGLIKGPLILGTLLCCETEAKSPFDSRLQWPRRIGRRSGHLLRLCSSESKTVKFRNLRCQGLVKFSDLVIIGALAGL